MGGGGEISSTIRPHHAYFTHLPRPGADDYLCKPFSTRELLARIKVLLRRLALIRQRAPQSAESLLDVGDLRLDLQRYQATWKGAAVPLTVTEFQILPVDLGALLESIVEGCGLRARHGLSFDLAKPEAALVVHAVPDRLTQVFENLLDNAVSFSPAGAQVRVALRAEGKTALVSVADQGPGVPPEHVEKIFARFFSYRPGSPSANGHAGLGLPIARAIVEGYGGHIEVVSSAEGGTRFEVRLRAA